LATNGLTVQSILGSFGLLLGLIGDEGVSLSAVVSIKNLSKLFKFSLELFTGGSDGNSVDEEFAILGDVDVVGGHLDMSGPSLTVLTIHLVFRQSLCLVHLPF